MEGILTDRKILQDAVVATGNGSAIEISGYEYLVLQVAGITTATIVPEVSQDGTNFVTARCMSVGGIDSLTAITTDGVYVIRIGGQRVFRARVSAWSAGTVTVGGIATSVCPFPIGYGLQAAGFAASFTITPTLNAAIYAAGDAMGTNENTLSNAVRVSGGGGIIDTVIISDLASQNAALDLVFFNAEPTGTTFTNNAALTIVDADIVRIIGVVEISETDYNEFVTNSVATLKDINLPFVASGSADIYMAIVCRSTPTPVSVSDLQVIVTILQD